MHISRILSVLLCAVLALSLAACGGGSDPTIDASSSLPRSSEVTSSEEEPVDPYANCVINPLTGEKKLAPEAEGRRPTAVVINNLFSAQKVQSGLDKADIVFETEVEGGITRLLALFSDPSDIGNIGTIRSLRLPFAQIACGMNAMLFFHGMDNTYCRPYLPTIDLDYHEIDASRYGFREKNGLSYEHTLYSTGEKIMKATEARKFDTSGGKTWLNFAEGEEPVLPGEEAAERVKVKFNGTSTTCFYYDGESGKYSRANKNGDVFKTYHTGKEEQFTNVFVLTTSIYNYPDGYHRAIDLSSGKGIYISAGRKTEINWKKGDADDNFSFSAADGTPLTVNKGNSYVCIINNSGQVTVENEQQ